LIETPLRHPGTGRAATVVCAARFWEQPPVSVAAGYYVLVVVSLRVAQLSSVETARSWVNAGACYVCAWGPNSPEIEETFDHSAFLPELGEPLPFTLMTTCHTAEPLEEALWFAFYNSKAPNEPEDGVCPVVVVADSEALAATCATWIKESRE
jgi:hypothetical protein